MQAQGTIETPTIKNGAIETLLARKCRAQNIGLAPTTPDQERIALILPPGCMSGVETTGFLAGLKQEGLLQQLNQQDAILGVSVGAIEILYLFDLRQGLQLFQDLSGSHFINRSHEKLRVLYHYMSAKKGATRPIAAGSQTLNSIINMALLKEKLDFDYNKLMQFAPALRVITTDLDTGQSVCHDLKDVGKRAEAEARKNGKNKGQQLAEGKAAIIQICLASCLIPGVGGLAVDIGGVPHGDGYIANPYPIRTALELGATQILLPMSQAPQHAVSTDDEDDRQVVWLTQQKYPHGADHYRASREDVAAIFQQIGTTSGETNISGCIAYNGKTFPLTLVSPKVDAPVTKNIETNPTKLLEGFMRGYARALDVIEAAAKNIKSQRIAAMHAAASHVLGIQEIAPTPAPLMVATLAPTTRQPSRFHIPTMGAVRRKVFSIAGSLSGLARRKTPPKIPRAEAA